MGADLEFQGIADDGPANCREGKEQIDALRESLKGARFKKRLV